MIYPARTRKSVTLHADDLRRLDAVRDSPEALAALGASPSVTEAALLRLLLVQGLDRASDAAQEAGYAALAASFRDDPDEQAVRAAVRARRRVREDVGA